jgi:ectoine hydroxylase-related dioxygenase (phytanoyl-CoA dioxygenase family)
MTFDEEMSDRGWAVFPAHMDADLVEWMKVELAESYELCRTIQVRNGVADATEHTVHHLVGQGHSWLTCLEEMPNEFIEAFFGGPFVLNSFGGNINPPAAENYAAKIHRDIRSYFTDRVMLNAIVALDDLTAENGATWLMNRGQFYDVEPTEELFAGVAKQVIAPAGSVILFDSRVWHRAGLNRSGGPRRIVTPMYTKPFYKPQFDYCRALEETAFLMSDELRQIIGVNARVPATLDEWYQPPERRCYRPNQG